MKKLFLTMALMLSLAAPALAEDAAPVLAPVDKPALTSKEEKGPRFSERKAATVKMLGDRISEAQARIAEMEKKLDCVQAAGTPEALQACFPNAGKYGSGESTGWEERRKEWREFHEGWKRKHGLGGSAPAPATDSPVPNP